MTGVLEGIKVVEMGIIMAGPTAGALLADWGAEVIKVEPIAGEQMRRLRRTEGIDTSQFNVNYELLGRNKKGVALDLKMEAGRNILYQLIQRADVFVSNHLVDVLNRLKLDYATLSQINPRLIYAIGTGYGTVGPDKDERAMDRTAGRARAGIFYEMTFPGCPPPRGPTGLMDKEVGVFLFAGILGALLHREKTGKGQELEVSLFHAGAWMNSTEITSALRGGVFSQSDRTKAENPMSNDYPTKDNRWLHISMTQSDRFWPDFCRALERPELENDPRFNNMETRRQNREELIRILDEVFTSRNLEEWCQRLRKHHMTYGPHATPEEVTTDPQALACGFFAEVEHPALGKLKLVTTPVNFSQNPASVRTCAPELGQHTEETLLDLGYSWEDIAQLKEQGVIP